MRTPAEVTDLITGVEIMTNDQGKRTTFCLSLSRTLFEFGLAGLSLVPRK